jgi:hypothetical protein
MLPVIGVLIVCLGQWWEAGLYALGPLVWLMIGWVARVTAAEYMATRPLADDGQALK